MIQLSDEWEVNSNDHMPYCSLLLIRSKYYSVEDSMVFFFSHFYRCNTWMTRDNLLNLWRPKFNPSDGQAESSAFSAFDLKPSISINSSNVSKTWRQIIKSWVVDYDFNWKGSSWLKCTTCIFQSKKISIQYPITYKIWIVCWNAILFYKNSYIGIQDF